MNALFICEKAQNPQIQRSILQQKCEKVHQNSLPACSTSHCKSRIKKRGMKYFLHDSTIAKHFIALTQLTSRHFNYYQNLKQYLHLNETLHLESVYTLDLCDSKQFFVSMETTGLSVTPGSLLFVNQNGLNDSSASTAKSTPSATQ